MGLPLYVPPVESDVRTKNTAPSTQTNNRIRRTRRRSSESLREIRRRAILTEAMSQAVTTAHTDLSREQWQNRHLSRLRIERQARALESDPIHQTAFNQDRREPIRDLAHLAHHDPEELIAVIQRHHDRARLLLNQELNTTTNPVTEESVHRFLANMRDPDLNMFSGTSRGSNPATLSSVPGPSNPRNTSVPGVPHNSGTNRPRGPNTHEIAPTPSYRQSIASTDQPTASEHYSNTFVGALNQELAQAAGHPRRHWDTEGPFPIDEPEQPLRSTTDHFMGFDEPEPPRAPRRRIASSLRRGAATPSNPARRPTVGWSDNATPTGPTGPSSSPGTSRIFGDVNQIRNGPEAASARQYGWAVRYIDGNNISNVNSPLPSFHDLLSTNQVDGLGDRLRSLSPEGDGVWNTLLTTLTPDPQPPSLGSSFASTTEALAAAAAQEQPSSSQPTVVPTPNLSAPPAVPSPTARRGDENRENRSSAPLPVAATRAQMAAVTVASRDTGSASPAGGSSGPSSASASQRIRSPFTAASAGTEETGDESAVLGGVGLEEEDGCDDIDMDRRHEDFELDADEEDEEEQADFLGLSSRPSLARIGYLRANVTRQRMMEEQIQLQHGLARQILRERGTSNSPQRTQPGATGPHQTEEALDHLGIGGMQHIVRSLARREDIPDEWWAEAGLSRTLPREESS